MMTSPRPINKLPIVLGCGSSLRPQPLRSGDTHSHPHVTLTAQIHDGLLNHHQTAPPAAIEAGTVAIRATVSIHLGGVEVFDPQKLLGSIVGQALGGAFGGRRGRKNSVFSTGDLAAKASLGLGALGIAMAAYDHYRQQPQAAAQPTASIYPPVALPAQPPVHYAQVSTLPVSATPAASAPAPPPPPAARDLSTLSETAAESVLLVRTMIAAAAADGVIDVDERARIVARTADAGLDAETRAFLEAELAVPKSADDIAAMTRPALVNEIYAAALLAVNLDQESERRFLERLGAGLGLSVETQQEIQAQLLS